MKKLATLLVPFFPLMLSGCGVDRALRVASAVTAHEICSQTFVAGRDPESIFRDYARPLVRVALVEQRLGYKIDAERREVTASVGGGFSARAAYAEGRGCTVMQGKDVPAPLTGAPIAATELAVAIAPRSEAAIDRAFTPDRKAIVVVKGGRIVGERYAPGYGPRTPMQSWSMAKSVTNALIGLLVRDRKLRIDAPVPGLPNGITVDHLLRQTSGQPYGSSNSGFDLSTRMQFLEPDTAAFAAAARFEGRPGEHWSYTDANFQLLSGVIAKAAGGTPQSVVDYARANLFGPLGMSSAVLEFDEGGTPMGASWVFANPRDWAKFGLLYLHDGIADGGIADGRRILPEGWVAYSAAPTPPASVGYGAGFWTNRGDSEGAKRRQGWGMPADSFFALGNSGQLVLIVPSHDLVIVSLGFDLDSESGAPVKRLARLTAEAIVW